MLPKRRWLRYSLRTFLLLTALLCAWLSIQVNAARRQREAVAAILRLRGSVSYDYEMIPWANSAMPKPFGARPVSSYYFDPRIAHPGSDWLRERIGDDYFRTAVAVTFTDPLRPLAKSDLDQLTKLPALIYLSLDGRKTGPVKDADLLALGDLRRLEELYLMYTRVNGSILTSLRSKANITVLCLDGTAIDDNTMEQIGTMRALHHLSLGDTHVTDAGLAHIQNLTNLEYLGLARTDVTDAGLQYLIGLKKLTDLVLEGTRATPDGFEQLENALPNTKIWPRTLSFEPAH